jgi:hypothetical protein
MLRRSSLPALSLGLAILMLCQHRLAQRPATPARPAEKSPAQSVEEQVYKLAKATLSRYGKQLDETEKQVKETLEGATPEELKELTEGFADTRKELQELLKGLEARVFGHARAQNSTTE